MQNAGDKIAAMELFRRVIILRQLQAAGSEVDDTLTMAPKCTFREFMAVVGWHVCTLRSARKPPIFRLFVSSSPLFFFP